MRPIHHRPDARPEGIDPIEGRLPRKSTLAARGAESGLGDPKREVFAHLAPPEHLADREGDVRLPPEGPLGPLGGGRDGGQVALRGLEQVCALARPFRGQERILADNEALARIVGVQDPGRVLLIEERERPGAAPDQRLYRRRPQRGDSVEPLDRPEIVPEAGRDEHPPVADQHHAREREPLAELRDLGRQRLGVAVLPAKTSTATGQPSPLVRSPKTVWRLSRRPSREWPNCAKGHGRPSK